MNIKRQRTKIKCQGCGKEFYPKSGHLKQKYCSKACGYKFRKTGGKKGKTYLHLRKARIGQCPVCNQTFRAVSDHNGKKGGKIDRKQKYCSKKCWNKRKPPVIKICQYCLKKFQTRDYMQIYCSHKCLWTGKEYPKGAKANHWKGGASLTNDRALFSKSLKIWRHNVYQRDKYTCQICVKKGGSLHAHHIKPFADYIELRFMINNGQTLCEQCHGKIHGKDFTKRKKKECQTCGKIIKNKNGTNLCLSCGVKKSWILRKAKSNHSSTPKIEMV